MTSIETTILTSIWSLYQKDQISLEQKWFLKDLLISGDRCLRKAASSDKDVNNRLLDFLHSREQYIGLVQGSPRGDIEELIVKSQCTNNDTPTTTQPAQKNRLRFGSSTLNAKEINQKTRSQSFHD